MKIDAGYQLKYLKGRNWLAVLRNDGSKSTGIISPDSISITVRREKSKPLISTSQKALMPIRHENEKERTKAVPKVKRKLRKDKGLTGKTNLSRKKKNMRRKAIEKTIML
ncbi:MAG: hypothetical protein PHF35_01900 [Candidatus Moranbacteria bacterium]|nr:hypothetical protein [Candidatus Moranbacteria bacterium]